MSGLAGLEATRGQRLCELAIPPFTTLKGALGNVQDDGEGVVPGRAGICVLPGSKDYDLVLVPRGAEVDSHLFEWDPRGEGLKGKLAECMAQRTAAALPVPYDTPLAEVLDAIPRGVSWCHDRVDTLALTRMPDCPSPGRHVEQLGEGSFGSVALYTVFEGNRRAAKSFVEAVDASHEAFVLAQIARQPRTSPHFVETHGWWAASALDLRLVMAYERGTSLEHALSTRRRVVPSSSTRKAWAGQLVEGAEFLAAAGCDWGDVSGDNVLIRGAAHSDVAPRLTIIDFGAMGVRLPGRPPVRFAYAARACSVDPTTWARSQLALKRHCPDSRSYLTLAVGEGAMHYQVAVMVLWIAARQRLYEGAFQEGQTPPHYDPMRPAFGDTAEMHATLIPEDLGPPERTERLWIQLAEQQAEHALSALWDVMAREDRLWAASARQTVAAHGRRSPVEASVAPEASTVQDAARDRGCCVIL